MNETDNSRDLSTAPKDRRELTIEFATGGTRCTARSTRTGEPCKRPAMLGGNVCYHHGGAAPQVRAKAKRRLEQASDALVQRLLQFAMDGGVDDNVALRAIRDALDRAGLMAKTEIAVEVKAPWEELLGDVAQITKAQHEAMKRGEYQPATLPDPAALPPAREDRADVVDAEVVEDTPERTGERAAGTTPPEWAEPAPARRTHGLTTEEQAMAALPAARVSHPKRKRR